MLIDGPSGGDNPEPDWFRQKRGYEPHDCPRELFNLDSDLSERRNCHDEQHDGHLSFFRLGYLLVLIELC